jgi:hypothetical protein
VREAGGEAVALTTVLGRVGVRSGRGLDGLIRALVPDLTAIEDPVILGRSLMEGLARKLEETGGGVSEDAAYPPRPEILLALEALPGEPGVYVFRDGRGSPLYVGKARSLRERAGRHFAPEGGDEDKGRQLARRAADLTWEETGSELEALLLEHLAIQAAKPPLNTQVRVHVRPRGHLRHEELALALPSRAPGCVEICLAAGDGRFHWGRVPREPRLPHGLWTRIRGFLGGESGWGPGNPGEVLPPERARDLAEITLSWLARNGEQVTRIDLRREGRGRPLRERLRRLLAEDPGHERVELR